MYLDDDFNEIVGKVLKKYRIKKGYSLAELARKIGGMVTRQTLHQYEQSALRLKQKTFEAICTALNITPQEFLNEVNALIVEKNREK